MAEKTDNTPFSVGNIWFPALSYNTFVPPKEKRMNTRWDLILMQW